MWSDYNAPRLFVLPVIDGAGHRLKVLIEGLAVAVKNNMNFGGMLAMPGEPLGEIKTEHGIDFAKLVNGFFGSPRASRELLRSRRPKLVARVKDVADLEHRRHLFKSGENVLCSEVNTWYYDRSVPVSRYFTAELRAALLHQLASRRLAFAPGRLTVAIHVRCGEATWKGMMRTSCQTNTTTTLWRPSGDTPQLRISTSGAPGRMRGH